MLEEGALADVSLWDLTSLALLPKTDPVSLLIQGSRTQAGLSLPGFTYLSVLYFKSNDRNPAVNPPFRPSERARLKRARRDPSEPGVV